MNLKELATFLGLSQTTVSRALNGYPEVAEETRKRVAEAAQKYQYRPNASARRLATGLAGSLGIVFPIGRNLLLDPHFIEFLAGISERLSEVEMDVTLSATRGDDVPVYRRLARTRAVDAVIVSGPLIEDPRIALLAEIGMPVVVHGRTRASRPYAHLDIDNQGAFKRATDLLLDFGHTAIALVNGDRKLTFAMHREEGWRQAIVSRGLTARPDYAPSGAMSEENGYRFARQLLERPDPPTAFVISSVISALGVQRALRDLGLVAGRDVSLVAHDDGLPAIRPDVMMPALTTTYSSIRMAGERLGAMALDLINGAPVETLTEVWPVDLVLRDSVARPPG